VIVGVSGGVDSVLLLHLAAETLGQENVLAATAIGLFYPKRDTDAAREAARRIGVELVEIDMADLDDRRILDNPPDRCYWCKRLLFGRLVQLAQQRGLATVASGSNADDVNTRRPGTKAEEELDIARPLLQAGLTKAEIRDISRFLGLDTWNRPSQACLASRLPYGRPLDDATLRRIERAEEALYAMGFDQCRCRDHEILARIEVPAKEMGRAMELRLEIVDTVRKAGYTYVTLDLQGFRSGSADEALDAK
jgi:uncharacterized protein